MSLEHSVWGSVPITGSFNEDHWKDAGIIAVPNAYVLLKNDAEYLYVALDFVADTVAATGTEDYFWFDVDVDQDGAITARKDLSYGLYPTLPIRLARCQYLGPGTWTGILPDPSKSSCQRVFAPTGRAAAPHAVWLLKIDLAEIGVDTIAAVPPPMVRFGFRLASNKPHLIVDSPDGFFTDFRSLHEVVLAVGSDAPVGPGLLTSIGNIPVGKLAGGRATTDANYHPFVTGAAFSGTLNFIASRQDVAALWQRGARRYSIERQGPRDATYQPVRTSWFNYLQTPAEVRLVGFTPDNAGRYRLANPVEEYSTRDLFCQLRTAGPPLAPGPHKFRASFFTEDGTAVPYRPATPAADLATLFIDNHLPTVAFNEIRYGLNGQWNGATVLGPCSVTAVGDAGKQLMVSAEVFDEEGNLAGYELTASHGINLTTVERLEVVPSPGPGWGGYPEIKILLPTTFPKVTCAYQLKLTARPNTTDGYNLSPATAAATAHLTLVRPGERLPQVTSRPGEVSPRGRVAGARGRSVVG